MKILFLAKFYQPFDRGGSEWSTRDLAYLLTRDGHSVTVVTPNYGAKSEETIDKIKIIRIPFPIKLKNPKSSIAPFWTNNLIWFFYSFLACLYYIYKDKKIDVIHVQNNEFIPAAALSGLITKIPTVVTFRDYQALCPLGFCVWHKNKACSLIDFVLKDFTFFFKNYVRNKNVLTFSLLLAAALRAKLMQLIIKLFSNRITAKVAVSSKLKKIFSENYIQGLKVIHNPVIVEGVNRTDSTVILYVGKFSPGKGVNLLLDIIPGVLKKLKEASFTLIGSGYLEKDVKDKITENRLERKVKLTGQLSHNKVLNLTKKAGLVIVPSIWQEPLPRSVIETILSGTPVVATDVGGINEVVKDNVYGVLTKTNSADLTKGLFKTFKNKSKYRKNILNNIKTLKKHFSQQSMDSYLSIYRSIQS